MTYTVYGLDRSYFSRKLELAMCWYGLPFEFRGKTMALSSEIEVGSGTRQVPVLHTPDDEYIADTTPIMMRLDELVPERRMFPTGPLGVLVHVIEEWFDEWLSRAALHYRWNFPASNADARAAISAQVAPEAAAEARDMIANGIAHWGGKACRAAGMTDPALQRTVEDTFRRTLAAATRQLADTAFLLGDRPCAVDAVVAGGIRAHFDVEPDPRAVVDAFPDLRAWNERCNSWDGTGALAPFPASTPFAQFVLREAAGHYRAFVLANRAAMSSGDKAFTIAVGDSQVSIRARPYPETSRRMICARIGRLDPAVAGDVHAWLAQLGLADCFD